MVYVLVAAGGERATCLSDCSNIRDVFLRCIPRKATAHALPSTVGAERTTTERVERLEQHPPQTFFSESKFRISYQMLRRVQVHKPLAPCRGQRAHRPPCSLW